MKIRHVHASGRFDATNQQLVTALSAYEQSADVITITEVAPDKYADVLEQWAVSRGWHLYHPQGRGKDECAILSRRHFERRATHRLTDLTLRSGRTAPIYLITARVHDGPWFGVWHSPAHNGGLRRQLWPTRVYLSALQGLRAARQTMHGGGVVLAADWNLDLRRPVIYAQLAKPYPHMRFGVGHAQAPTEGGRVIDGVLTNLSIVHRTRTLPKQPGFDHAAVLTVLATKE